MYDVVFCMWYGVVWNNVVIYNVLFSNMGRYILIECIQSVI